MKVLYNLLALIICFFWSTEKAHSTIEVSSIHLTASDGLANNSVRHIFQDSKGFVWLGTLGGLNRYDGSSFITFRSEQGINPSLCDHRMRELTEDSNGFLWIRTAVNLYSCYDLKKGRFMDFTGCNEYANHFYEFLFEDKQRKEIWLYGTRNGCRRVSYKEGKFSSVTFKMGKGLKSNIINDLKGDSKGRIWIATSKGLYVWNNEKLDTITEHNKFRLIQEYDGKTYFLTSRGAFFMYDPDEQGLKKLAQIDTNHELYYTGTLNYGNKWILYTTEQTYCFDFESRSLVLPNPQIDLPNGHVTMDNKGNYWVNNRTGKLTYIQKKNGEVQEFQVMSPTELNYIDDERYSIVHDSRGILWIATYGNGLFAYNTTNGEMRHFLLESDNLSNVINSNYLLYLMEDRSGNIWVSSEFAGVSILHVLNEGASNMYFNPAKKIDRSNAVRFISTFGEDVYITTRTGDLLIYDSTLTQQKSSEFYDTNIYAITEDAQGRKWYGTRGKGLIIDGKYYRNNPSDSTSIESDQIYSILKDRKGRMWVGTFGGGLNLAIENNGTYTFRHFFLKNYGERRVRTLCEDRNGWIWAGTDEGVYVFNPDRLIADPTDYYNYSLNQGNLHSNEIKSIVLDTNGYVWIAESGAGFSYCQPGTDYARQTFIHYGVKDGLVNNMVQSFAEGNAGDMWISTEYGISRFNSRLKTFENHFFSNQIYGNIYSENSSTRLLDGRMAFGSYYGLSVVDPTKVKQDPNDLHVTFTDLKINGISVRTDDEDSPLDLALAYLSELNLKYDQNSFAIDFSTFSYLETAPKYSYMLENYDKDWSTPSAISSAAYKNLPPGTYYLHVRACNSSGSWGGVKNESILKITVVPPFWRTIWAYLLYAIILCGIIYIVYHYLDKLNTLRNSIKIEKQLTEYKLVFFTNISHEFRTPLTLIQGALEKMHKSEKVPTEMAYSMKIMDKSVQRMLRLINQLLEFRRMQNNKLTLSLEKADIIELLQDVYSNFKDIAESKEMDYHFTSFAKGYKLFIDKGKIDKVVYNLLSNAFKYTPSGGKVELSAQLDEINEQLIIKVSDTGVGIAKEKRGELFKRFVQSRLSGNSMGIGLHLSYELINVHKGTISYEENPGGGSIFIVTLPTSAEVYEEKDFLVPDNILRKEEEVTEKHLAEIIQKDVITQGDNSTFTPPLNKRKILIIEDDDDVREYLKEELSVYFEVKAEADGETGLKRAQNYDADLIISDVMMLNMSGFELTKRLKGDFNTSHIPIILLTALDSSESHLKGIECGADAYITKPFSLKLLLTRTFKLIEQRDRLRDKFSIDPTTIRIGIYTSERDKQFVEKLALVVEKHMSNAQLSIDDLANMVGIGRSLFYRKVRGMTGYSPNEYLRIMRMKKATELLQDKKMTITEVSRRVGINDPFYFSKCFKTQYGVSPSVYQKEGEAAIQAAKNKAKKETANTEQQED